MKRTPIKLLKLGVAERDPYNEAVWKHYSK